MPDCKLPQVTIREPTPDTPVTSTAAGSIHDRLTSPAPAEGPTVPTTPTLRSDAEHPVAPLRIQPARILSETKTV